MQAGVLRAVRHPLALLSALMLVLVVLGWLFLTSGSKAGASKVVLDTRPVTERVTVGPATPAPAIANSFIGFSIEYQSVANDAGTVQNPDTVMDKLIEDVNPGQRPVIRIGGDSTDHTWWPITGIDEGGLEYSLTPDWLASIATFAKSTDAQLILGINLEADDPEISQVEARALLDGIGADNILAWEIGNEPSLYPVFPWYTTVTGSKTDRVFKETKPSYNPASYAERYEATAAKLPSSVGLAGPALGAPAWMVELPTLLKAEPQLKTVTYHAYPLNCFAPKSSDEYPSIANLLSTEATIGLADGVAKFASEARAAGRSFRVDELNTSACGGSAGVSDTFASALWATDALFAMASRGVSGVNIQTFDSSRYKPFSFKLVNGHWEATVEPMYYGLLLFSRAAPAGSKLLSATTSQSGAVHAWAAQTTKRSVDAGAETVTLINDSTTRAETVAVTAAGTNGGTVERMLAPSATAKSGVTLDGMSFPASTATATMTGDSTGTPIAASGDGAYHVTLRPGSAALLVLKRR